VSAYDNTRTVLALTRLSNRYGVTKRKPFERLLTSEEEKLLQSFDLDGAEDKKYLGELDQLQ
jgi:hypothetical protein